MFWLILHFWIFAHCAEGRRYAIRRGLWVRSQYNETLENVMSRIECENSCTAKENCDIRFRCFDSEDMEISLQCVLHLNASRLWSINNNDFEKKSCSVYSEAFHTPCDTLHCPKSMECKENEQKTEGKCVCKEKKTCGGIQVNKSGVYEIPTGNGNISVWCDMDTLCGGWIVFQRRLDGSVSFERSWADYKHGFGSISGEHWLGNDKVHSLTTAENMDILVEMKEYNRSCKLYAMFSNFTIGNESENYKLGSAMTYLHGSVGGLSFESQRGYAFTTFDNNNDVSGYNCGIARNFYKGGWWFHHCWGFFPNALYTSSGCAPEYGYIIDSTVHGYYHSFPWTELKIRTSEKRAEFNFLGTDKDWCAEKRCDIKCRRDPGCGCPSYTEHCFAP